MIIECLPRNTFDKNMQDFSKCEDKWKVFPEIDEDFLKKGFEETAKIVKMVNPNENIDGFQWEFIKFQLEKGRVVGDPLMLYRIKTDLPHCPLCGGSFDESKLDYSLSRRDNKTKICSQCGTNEAFDDYFDQRG